MWFTLLFGFIHAYMLPNYHITNRPNAILIYNWVSSINCKTAVETGRGFPQSFIWEPKGINGAQREHMGPIDFYGTFKRYRNFPIKITQLSCLLPLKMKRIWLEPIKIGLCWTFLPYLTAWNQWIFYASLFILSPYCSSIIKQVWLELEALDIGKSDDSSGILHVILKWKVPKFVCSLR